MAIAETLPLSTAELRLQSILETALDAYVSMDAQGCIRDWNRQAEATFGWSRDEALGQTLAETIIPPQYRDAHARGLAHFLRTGEGPVLNRRLHIAALHRDGHEFPVELTIWPLREDGVWTFHAFVRDVTNLREAQRLALESERQAAVADIFSVLAHDGSNALQQIQMATDLLAIELSDNAEALAQLDGIQKSRERLESLLKDVHGYAIPLKLRRGQWSLADIWHEAWAQLAAQRQSRDIEFIQVSTGADLRCAVDRTGMEQAFRVILQNSLARCTDPVRIEIQCHDDTFNLRPAVRIHVRDNGPSLPSEQWQQVFGMVDFARRHEPAAELAIAARIIDAHGGRITASGRFLRGAEFMILLPREA